MRKISIDSWNNDDGNAFSFDLSQNIRYLKFLTSAGRFIKSMNAIEMFDTSHSLNKMKKILDAFINLKIRDCSIAIWSENYLDYFTDFQPLLKSFIRMGPVSLYRIVLKKFWLIQKAIEKLIKGNPDMKFLEFRKCKLKLEEEPDFSRILERSSLNKIEFSYLKQQSVISVVKGFCKSDHFRKYGRMLYF